MTATFTGAKRKIIYQPGQNNTWVQIPKLWSGYIFAMCGIPPARVDISMDEYGMLTIKPDFELEGLEIAQQRQNAIMQGHNGEAETWLREHGKWQSEDIITKRGRPTTKRKKPIEEE